MFASARLASRVSSALLAQPTRSAASFVARKTSGGSSKAAAAGLGFAGLGKRVAVATVAAGVTAYLYVSSPSSPFSSLGDSGLVQAAVALAAEHSPLKTTVYAAAPAALTAVINKADKLYDDGDMEDLYRLLSVHLVDGKGPSAEITWRAARAAKEMALLSKDAEQKKKFVYEAYNLAKAALEQDPNNFACHKWMGITISEVGDYEGVKVKISNAFEIKKHFDKAAELNPKDATSHHLVGMWCYTFADMPWYQRKIASALFASPPSATYEEALNHFVTAEKVDPGFYVKNTLMIGKVYSRLNQKDQAKEWLQKAVAMKVNNPSDQEAHDEAATLLKQL